MNNETIKIPNNLAVMVLPGATLFPHSILPLFIFEMRYRQMLADALDSGRMFCIAQLKPDVTECDSNDCFYQVGGVGLIRVCRGNDDGTSHLILQGTGRVRFLSYDESRPYRYAEIAAVPTRILNPGEVAARRVKIIDLCQQIAEENEGMKHIAAGVRELEDSEAATDIVAGACISNPVERQRLLEEEVLDSRMEYIIQHLEKMLRAED